MNDNYKVLYKKSTESNKKEFQNIDNFANAYIATTDITNAPVSNLTPEHSTTSTDTDGQSSANVFIMSPVLAETSPLKETSSDPFGRPRCLRQADNLCVIITSMVVFSISITVALIIQIYVGAPQVNPHSGIVSDDPYCTKIGFEVLKMKEASTVDAAIVTALCICVTQPHAASMGGGGFALVHDQQKKSHSTEFYNFREMSSSIFDNNSAVDEHFTGKSRDEVAVGPSIAVPGVLKGLEMLHIKYNSKVTFSSLITHLIPIARDGFPVSPQLASAIDSLQLDDLPTQLRTLVTKPGNISVKLEAGDILKQPLLAVTLQLVADFGTDVIYNGTNTQNFVQSLQDLGGVLTFNDMANYKPTSTNVVNQIKLEDQIALTGDFPSSGPALFSTLSAMSGYENPTTNPDTHFLQAHRLAETLKYSLAELGNKDDSNNNTSKQWSPSNIGSTIRSKIVDNTSYPVEHYLRGYQPLTLSTIGQQHVAAIGADGKVVTILLSLGSTFGSKQMVSGLVLNDAMLDFSWEGKNKDDTSGLPPSQGNIISGKKQPISSLVPVLVIPSGSKCGKYFALNGMFGFQTISSLAQTILNSFQGINIKTSINNPRIHQQLEPYHLLIEDGNPIELDTFLINTGHNITRLPSGQTIGVNDAVKWTEKNVTTFLDKRGNTDNMGYSF